MELEKEICLINKIIRESIIHGVDLGGSYEQNEENLKNAINDWLYYKNLLSKYVIRRIETGDGWYVHQIVTR